MVKVCIDGFDAEFEVDIEVTSCRSGSKDIDDYDYTIDHVTYGGLTLDVKKVCVLMDMGPLTVENLLYKAIEDIGSEEVIRGALSW